MMPGLYTRDKPIRSMDDIEGMILRSPSAAQAGQIEAWAARPSPCRSPNFTRNSNAA
jgi:TRAP-type C4-dicarboxylate transport system substrate-binding protein